MRYKLLGRSGLRVSELALGTMTFMEGLSWGSLKQESQRVYETFMAAGGNFIDTANSYGTSEEYLAEFIGDDRDRVVIGTKYTGRNMASDLPKDANAAGSHRKSMARSVEGSLKRLKTDYIDLLWVHSWDFMTPVEEVMRGLDDLLRQGKILYVGISNAPAWVVAQANTLAELRGWSPFVGLQIEYNLVERSAERDLIPMARALDIGVTAWTPLASGWLTGKYSSSNAPRISGAKEGRRRLDDPVASAFVQRNERNMAIVEEVINIATEIDCTPAQVALNWLRQQSVIPVVGARKVEQMRGNLDCLKSSLSEGQMQRLNDVSKIKLGYPHDFLASGMVRHHIYGGMFEQIDDHRNPRGRRAEAGDLTTQRRKISIGYAEKFIN
jgi:aryl-alcohol dehydrogenase-like predicted oxidoreductase